MITRTIPEETREFSSLVMSIDSIQCQGVQIRKMAEVKAPPLPDEYEAMFADTVKDIKEIVMKIRGTRVYSV